ncbi:MAG: aspartate aminotransferase family protein [Candidatus Krumholzibacteria bacterium]|jgi:alanine-glyoxylate transaminase/(R)-3-amino-2-methylpropionate-pyruvate transaminase|nr:aspartate aminotransferase family protein [Candidatus Krumholzibacteria bacterium]MDP6669441.1 aspartate aminotransferase family protein [Candidatus Krumholzibacteria bacterium]MDP6796948.1 aspartate aminotransferase family protein [Candidatus Krumholzibacteria bacterium]MDP7021960.1 aspartate aminotransferase family protein [Candidatus Krumholzibacteria bacterium]
MSQPTLPDCKHQARPYDGPDYGEVLNTRREHLNPAIFTLYKEPLMIVEGHMQYLFDEKGRRYLDLFAGIVTVSCGHCHPRVTDAMSEQLQRIQHTTTIYLNPLIGEYAKRLASKLPGDLDVLYFVNSGSEANDLALMMSRLYTGHHDVLAVRNAYHGASPTAMGLTSHHTWKYPVPHSQGIHHVPCPDPSRSRYQGSPEEIASSSAEEIRDIIRFSTPGKVAAFIAEPIQGVGGATYGSRNYLGEAYGIVREHGGLCIADEVQTGFGRTGDHFWGFENFDVQPDIVTMAKGIGNGAPLAAVATRREIAEVLTQRIHFNTYGGNPISMAAGLAVLDVIEEEGLQENSKVLGARFHEGLLKLKDKHSLIYDVRGMGLMIGVELRDKEDQPATAACAEVLEQSRERGLLVGKGGLFGNVLRIKPPMCISADDVDFALEVLDIAIEYAAKA